MPSWPAILIICHHPKMKGIPANHRLVVQIHVVWPLPMAMPRAHACPTSRVPHPFANPSAWLAPSVHLAKLVSINAVRILAPIHAAWVHVVRCLIIIPSVHAKQITREIHSLLALAFPISLPKASYQEILACHHLVDPTPFARSNRTVLSALVWPTTLEVHPTVVPSVH